MAPFTLSGIQPSGIAGAIPSSVAPPQTQPNPYAGQPPAESTDESQPSSMLDTLNPFSIPQASAQSAKFMTKSEFGTWMKNGEKQGISAQDVYDGIKTRGYQIEGDPTPNYVPSSQANVANNPQASIRRDIFGQDMAGRPGEDFASGSVGKNPIVGIFSGMGNDIQNAASGLNEAASDTYSGRQNIFSGGLQVAGHLAGGVGNVLSEPLKPVLGPFIQALHDSIKKEPGLLGPIFDALGQQGDSFSLDHPELAKNMAAVVKIASLPLAMQGAESNIDNVGNIAGKLNNEINALPWDGITKDQMESMIQGGEKVPMEQMARHADIFAKYSGVGQATPEQIASIPEEDPQYYNKVNALSREGQRVALLNQSGLKSESGLSFEPDKPEGQKIIADSQASIKAPSPNNNPGIMNKIPGASSIKNYAADRQAFTNAEDSVSPLEKLAMPKIDPRDAAAEGRQLVTDSKGQPIAGMPTQQEVSAAKTLEKIPQFQEQNFDPNSNLSKSSSIIENARKTVFGPQVEKAAGKINFAFGENEYKGLLQNTMEANDQNIVSGTEGQWQKTMDGFIKKFSSYSENPDYTPSQAAWKAESDMMKTIPQNQIDSATTAKAMSTKAMASSVRDFLTSNAERMAKELEANPETASQAAPLREFQDALTDYRNIKNIQENITSKMPGKLSLPPPSVGEIAKGVVKGIAKKAAFGAEAGLGLKGVSSVLR